MAKVVHRILAVDVVERRQRAALGTVAHVRRHTQAEAHFVTAPAADDKLLLRSELPPDVLSRWAPALDERSVEVLLVRNALHLIVVDEVDQRSADDEDTDVKGHAHVVGAPWAVQNVVTKRAVLVEDALQKRLGDEAVLAVRGEEHA